MKKRDLDIDRNARFSRLLYESKPTSRQTIDDEIMRATRRPNRYLLRAKAALEKALKKRAARPAAKPARAIPRARRGASRRFYITVCAMAAAFIAVSAAVSAVVFAAPLCSVTLNDSGRILRARTAEATVGEFLTENGVTIDTGDVVESSLAAPITDGMEIVIRRALPVTINVDGTSATVEMLAGTVGEALAKAGVSLSEDDEVYPASDTYVVGDLSVDIIRVTYEYITETETLYYKEIRKNDSTLEKGKTRMAQGGENGSQENEIKITYKNGVEIERVTVKTTVTKEPVNEIIMVGTYVRPTPTPAPTSPPASDEPQKTKSPSSDPTKKPSSDDDNEPNLKWPTNSDGLLTKTPSVSLIHSSDTLSEHRDAPAPDESIIAKTVILDDCTAYCDSQTATGVRGQLGTIAADPKRFPYGTKVYVPGYGYGRIEDTGSMRHREETLWDLWMPSESQCESWGRKHNLKVYILK